MIVEYNYKKRSGFKKWTECPLCISCHKSDAMENTSFSLSWKALFNMVNHIPKYHKRIRRVNMTILVLQSHSVCLVLVPCQSFLSHLRRFYMLIIKVIFVFLINTINKYLLNTYSETHAYLLGSLYFNKWIFHLNPIVFTSDCRFQELTVYLFPTLGIDHKEWKLLSPVWLCDPMGYIVHGIIQTRILEWVAFPFSRGSSQPEDWAQVSRITGRFFTSLSAEPQGIVGIH